MTADQGEVPTDGKRSNHELTRLVEEAVRDEWDLEGRGLQLIVSRVEPSGRPPERLKIWATLHFLPAGSPFCCGEPGCHLTLYGEGLDRVADRVRRAMGLRQPVSVDFGDRIEARYHDGVEFTTERP